MMTDKKQGSSKWKQWDPEHSNVRFCDALMMQVNSQKFVFDKDDAIKIAKHFNLTAEDLK